jgi:hypothetical protein
MGHDRPDKAVARPPHRPELLGRVADRLQGEAQALVQVQEPTDPVEKGLPKVGDDGDIDVRTLVNIGPSEGPKEQDGPRLPYLRQAFYIDRYLLINFLTTLKIDAA